MCKDKKEKSLQPFMETQKGFVKVALSNLELQKHTGPLEVLYAHWGLR